MIPGTYNFTIVRGTTTPLVVRFTAPDPNDPNVQVPVPFTDAHLSIRPGSAGTVFVKKLSDDDPRFFISDDYGAEITWMPTPAESRSLQETKVGAPGKNSYEFELWNGTEQTVFLIGTITAIGGINDDV